MKILLIYNLLMCYYCHGKCYRDFYIESSVEKCIKQIM